MFKTSVKLMKMVSGDKDQISLAMDAKEIFEDLGPGRPDDHYDELPYDDWKMLVISKLGWTYGHEYVVANEGEMYVKPDYASSMSTVAPSFVAEAYLAHLGILHDTFYAGYNLAFHEVDQAEEEAAEEEPEANEGFSGGNYL